MSAGITITDQASSLRDNFREYVALNRRDSEYLWQDQCRKLGTDLYVTTAEIAPTKAEIASDVKALGWKIPQKFKDDRIGRGWPAQWIGWALQKRNRKIRRRGRKSKKDHLEEEEFKALKPTLAQMQQFVIDIRSHARLFLASGWLGAIVDLGGSVKASSGSVQRDRGGAIIRRPEPGLVEVTFWNRTPGIETMDEQKHFVQKAIFRRLGDMRIYIDRKRAEALAKIRKAA